MSRCPSEEVLRCHLDDRVADDTDRTLAAHVANCTACQQTLADLQDETEVASWRRTLQRDCEVRQEQQLPDLQRALRELKGNPPLHIATSCDDDAALQIRFPGPPTAKAPLGQLGDFDVLEELGRGTFGTVFKAFDRRLQREVAIKVLNPQHAAAGRECERFQREARAVSKLEHDHIVRMYDVRNESNFPLPYLVMEQVEGESLAELLSARLAGGLGPFTPQNAATIVRQVALALAAAHEFGLVHRDVKSSNILMANGSGRAKVTDFGLVRELRTSGEASTRSRTVIGTLPYMSPEQILHPDRVGPQSDLYSLGVVMYELLTGERPFRGTCPALMVQVAHDVPQSPRKLNPAIPRDLETICAKCLAKEPARRYSSAVELSDELNRFLTGEPILARPVSIWERAAKWAKRRRAVAALLVAVSLVTTVGFTGVLWQWRSAERGRQVARDAQSDAEVARDNERVLREQLERNLYFQRIALAHHEWLSGRQARADQLLSDCPQVHRSWEWHLLKRMIHPEIRALHGHNLDVRKVAFSPDGKRIASVGGLWNHRNPGAVIVWDARTGRRQRTFAADSGGFDGVAFSPDSRRLAAANSVEGVAIWNLQTGLKQFTASGRHYDIAFDHSGGLIAGAGAQGTVRIWNAHTGKLEHELEGDGNEIFSVDFSPDGKWLASAAKNRKVRIWDTQKGDLIRVFQRAGNRCAAFTPDGRFLASCGYGERVNTGLVKIWDVRDGWNLVVDQRVETGPVTWLSPSPDGRLLALTDARHAHVRVWETATGREKLLLRTPLVLGVAFSPDGRTIASCSRDQTVKLWDVTRREPVITRADWAFASGLAFHPDGKRLAIAGGQNTASGRGTKTIQIWDVANTFDCRLVRVLSGHKDWITSVAYNDDGERIASADRSGSIRIWESSTGRKVVSFQGGHREVSSVAFSPDGRFLITAGRESVVRLWDSTTGILLHSFEGHQDCIRQITFSSDGKLIASASDDGTARLWATTTGKVLCTLTAHEGPVLGVAFDSDARLLATCGSDGMIHLWSVSNKNSAKHTAQQHVRKPLRTLRGHTASVAAITFSREATRIASTSNDRTVKLWDVATGQEILTLTPTGSHVPTSVLFSPKGDVLAAARKHIVTLWSAKQRNRLHEVRRLLDWHENEARKCKARKNWFAATFHRTQMIALESREPTNYLRRGNLYHAWAKSNGGDNSYRETALVDYERAMELSNGLLLTGQGDHLTANHIPFDLYDAFTSEAWVYGGYQGAVIAQGQSGEPRISIWLSPGGSTRALESHTCGWESGDGDEYYKAIGQVPAQQWNHIAMVYDGNSQQLFLNGKRVQHSLAPRPGPFERHRRVMIGAHQSKRGKMYGKGLIRSIRVSRAVVYDADFTPSEVLQADDDTVLLYDFGRDPEWMITLTVTDLSGKGNDGEIHDPWWTK